MLEPERGIGPAMILIFIALSSSGTHTGNSAEVLVPPAGVACLGRFFVPEALRRVAAAIGILRRASAVETIRFVPVPEEMKSTRVLVARVGLAI